MVAASDSKSDNREIVRVRVPPPPPSSHDRNDTKRTIPFFVKSTIVSAFFTKMLLNQVIQSGHQGPFLCSKFEKYTSRIY